MSSESQSTPKEDLIQEAAESFIKDYCIVDTDGKVSQKLQDGVFQVCELAMIISLQSRSLFEIFSIYHCSSSCLKSSKAVQNSIHKAFEVSTQCSKKLMSYRLIEMCKEKDVDIQRMSDYTLLLQPVNAPSVELLFTYKAMILILPVEEHKPSCPLTYTVDILKNSQYPKEVVEFLIKCLYNGTELVIFP